MPVAHRPERTVRAPSGDWTVKVIPPDAPSAAASPATFVGRRVTVHAETRGGTELTAAGKAAAVSYLASYLDEATVATQHQRVGAPLASKVGCSVHGNGLVVHIEPADTDDVVAAVVAILETDGNVT